MEYARARVKLPPELAKLTTSQFNKAIDEANLGVVDALIARRYFLDKMPQADVAAELDVTRVTVTNHARHIRGRLVDVASRLAQ